MSNNTLDSAIKSEVSELLSSLGGDDTTEAVTEEATVDTDTAGVADVIDKPAEEEVVEEKVVEEEATPIVKASDAKEAVVETTAVETEETEEATPDEGLEFRKTVEDMSKTILSGEAVEKKPKGEAETSESAETKQTEQPKVEPLLTGMSREQWERAIESPEAFEREVASKLIARLNDSINSVLRVLPRVATNITRGYVDYKLAASDFFTANADLVGFRNTVTVEFDKAYSKNPNRGLDEVFEEAGKEARKRLRLGTTQTEKKKRGDVPSKTEMPIKGSRKPEKPKLTGVRAEVKDLLDL